MPVSFGIGEPPRAKRCKLCDESNHRSGSSGGYWQLELDTDLVETISAIYPEWFRSSSSMVEEDFLPSLSDSPPEAIIDTSPLHMDQNKESLKVKLMLRRPLDQLVAQGIMPPHKTPAAFHGQRRQLERAKTGDMLKAKIQQRPSRQELERRHILDPTDHHVDPSLAERQRMLKKAKLADHLNDQLSHRPGPLELIRKNILHTEEPIEQAVKTGQILYKATSEGQLNRPQHPSSYVNPEDDSQSSESSLGPSETDTLTLKPSQFVVSLIPPNKETVVFTGRQVLKDNDIVFTDLTQSVPLVSKISVTSPASLTSSTSTLSPLSSVASPSSLIEKLPNTPAPPPLPPANFTSRCISLNKSDAPGKDKNRKKLKSKAVPKARTIKFHEYKGPPSAKLSNASTSSGESSYDLLLQQQTLLLQFQLQLQHKFPQIILPASDDHQDVDVNKSQSSPAPSTNSDSSTSTRSALARLEDMKVCDLKAELKRRNLPVSGSKPQLIERLKVFSIGQENTNTNCSEVDQEICLPQSNKDYIEKMDTVDPLSPLPPVGINDDSYQQQHLVQDAKQKEELVKKQQKQIEELQRELTLSQLKLQAATRSGSEPKIQLLALQKHLQAKQQLQQQQLLHQRQQLQPQKNQQSTQFQQLQKLQAKQQSQLNEEQKRIQQQEHVAFQNQKNVTDGLLLNSVDASLVFNQLLQGKAKLGNEQQRANTIPSFLNALVSPLITTTDNSIIEATHSSIISNESVKHKPIIKKNHIKSQIVDDVLEILIKNGELPPSAAQHPLTPGSADTKNVEPIFSKNQPSDFVNTNQQSNTLGLGSVDELLDSLENLDNMDLSQFVMEISDQPNELNNNPPTENHLYLGIHMETDEWLDTLLPSSSNESARSNDQNNYNPSDQQDLTNFDPLLGLSHDPFDPFSIEDFRSSSEVTNALTWEKLDFAT